MGKFSQIANQLISQNICYHSNGIKMEFKIYKEQNCILQDSQTNKNFIVLIQNIITTTFTENKIHLFIQARLYYKKTDLIKEHKNILEECSENDLFLTNITAWFYCPKIVKIIFIKPINEYTEGKYIYEENCYWIRSEYNALTNEFEPDQTQWKRECCCNSICNPALYEKEVAFCKNCSFLFHIKCIQQEQQQLKKSYDVICKECLQNMKQKTKNTKQQIIISRRSKKL
ncbi:unnamed protein product [Paramecium primaurelia]|uniref:Uncharacterized protein n=1 Tax=Paramecium primaurelia TaxID=5886 RepID=A0A8S1QEX0_PARPR|nr:unnamed protein product [Paramecium primaurelia]